MEGLLIPLGFFATIAYVLVELTGRLSDARTRRKLIESGASPELAASLVAAPRPGNRADPMLRWGIVLAFIGAAFVVLQFLPYDENDPITSGILLLSLAGGFLASHAIARPAHGPALPPPLAHADALPPPRAPSLPHDD